MKINKINLIFFLPNFLGGGAGRSIMKICNNLSNFKYSITIISLGKCFYKKNFKKNVKFYELKQKKTFLSFFNICKILIKNYSNKNTIFISNMNYVNVLSCFFLKFILSYKLILVERTPLKELKTFYNINEFFKKKIVYLLMKLLYRFSDKVVVNSLYSQNEFKKVINCNLEVIHSPSIDKLNFKKFQKKRWGKLKILSIGRLSVEKRFDFLINTINKLKKFNIQLIIIGDGPLKEKLLRSIKEKKLNNKIKIIKFSKNYNKHFKSSDLYINTSDFEGFPNSVVEAINNNLRIYSRDSAGGIHDIITHKSIGKIINTDSYDIFADKLKKNYLYNFNKEDLTVKKEIINKKLSKFLSSYVSKRYELIFSNIF